MCEQYKVKKKLGKRLCKTAILAVIAAFLSIATVVGGVFNTVSAASNAGLDITINVTDAPLPPDNGDAGNNIPGIPDTGVENAARSTDIIFHTGDGNEHSINLWVIVGVLVVFLALSATTTIVIQKFFKQGSLAVVKKNKDGTESVDEKTEVIDMTKLIKKYKAKKILLQITPIFAFALVSVGVTLSMIRTNAATSNCATTGTFVIG